MKRRKALAGVGTAIATLAGCTTLGKTGEKTTSESTDDPPTETPSNSPSTPSEPGRDAGAEYWEFDPAETAQRRAVGDRPVIEGENIRPHPVNIWNAAEQRRTVAIHVYDGRTGQTKLQEGVPLPADAELIVTLAQPGEYDIEVSTAESEATETISIGTEYFDCNGSGTNVAVWPDGTVDQRTFTTLIACPDADDVELAEES